MKATKWKVIAPNGQFVRISGSIGSGNYKHGAEVTNEALANGHPQIFMPCEWEEEKVLLEEPAPTKEVINEKPHAQDLDQAVKDEAAKDEAEKAQLLSEKKAAEERVAEEKKALEEKAAEEKKTIEAEEKKKKAAAAKKKKAAAKKKKAGKAKPKKK